MVFPIGGLLFLNSNDDPNELYQGTSWTKLDGGRTIISTGTYSDSSGSYTYNLGDTGGEAKHALLVKELAEHNHPGSQTDTATLIGSTQMVDGRIGGSGIFNMSSGSGGYTMSMYNDSGGRFGIDASHSHTFSVAPSGSNTPHENRPPYIALNIWQRIA